MEVVIDGLSNNQHPSFLFLLARLMLATAMLELGSDPYSECTLTDTTTTRLSTILVLSEAEAQVTPGADSVPRRAEYFLRHPSSE